MKQTMIFISLVLFSLSSLAAESVKFSCQIENNPDFSFVYNPEQNEFVSANEGGGLDGLHYLPSEESALCYEEEVIPNSYSSTSLCFKKTLSQYVKGEKIKGIFTMVDYGWDTEDKYKMICQRF